MISTTHVLAGQKASTPASLKSRMRRWLGVAAVATTLAAATTTVAAQAAATPQAAQAASNAAESCIHQVFGVIPSSQPWVDMALGFSNGTSDNAPVGLRNSAALDRAELWIELDGPGSDVYLQNVNTDAGTFAVARSGDFDGATIVTKKLNTNDSAQRWKKVLTGSWVRYQAPNGKYISMVAGNSAKPFQLRSSAGDSYFVIKKGGCFEF